jgi:hypothetical protein
VVDIEVLINSIRVYFSTCSMVIKKKKENLFAIIFCGVDVEKKFYLHERKKNVGNVFRLAN